MNKNGNTWMTHIGETHADGTPHVPDPDSLTRADGFNADFMVLDISCEECGQSGSLTVDALLRTLTQEVAWV